MKPFSIFDLPEPIVTYRQLQIALERFSEDQLDSNLTMETPDGEIVPAKLDIIIEDDILDADHPVFVPKEK